MRIGISFTCSTHPKQKLELQVHRYIPCLVSHPLHKLYSDEMNSSQFMDKQIMDLTSSSSTTQSLALSCSPKIINSSSKDFIDLMNNPPPPPPPPPQDDSQSHINNNDLDDGIKREEIVASYDFQPIRPVFDPAAADSNSISSSASPLRVSLRLLLGFFTAVWLLRILVFGFLRDLEFF